ncbi:MAG TPA: DEAD/DEAH box helicase [Sphaerochaeta sp.]|nr:DEAD/DEAH box helicase [Sphaerochaeta sp.]
MVQDLWLKELGAILQEQRQYDAQNQSIWYETEACHLIFDTFCFSSGNPIFSYELYTSFQNRVMQTKKPVYRFLIDDEQQSILPWIENSIDFPVAYHTLRDRQLSVADSTPLEHFFEQRFCEVYGPDATRFLSREYPITSRSGNPFFFDYVVEYLDGTKVAIEENGVTYHHPLLTGKEAYRHQLEKQNTASYIGIKVFRFSSMDCQFPSFVDDQIIHFFGDRRLFRRVGLSVSRSYRLYEHQEEALQTIRESRRASTAPQAVLQVFPTATGKSRIVEEDLVCYLTEKPSARALIVGPTVRVVQDWLQRLGNLFLGTSFTYGTTEESQVLVGTYQLLWRLAGKLESDAFAYIVIDEAHHAVSPVLRRSLQYFQPAFLIGLTATPDRLDRKRLEDVFGTYRTTLDLRQAIEKKIVADVRSYRIETNLDLSEVRFNGREYVNADLERTLRVDSRNHLIVSILKQYFSQGQKGIVFCVNVAHTKDMERLLLASGIEAKAVRGETRGIEAIINRFRTGNLQFLCSCNLLNEGWDVPELEVLVMARPTISKVLYMQQLGRGLRRTEKKQELFVIDVVDQYGALARPWSCHALFSNPGYVPFGLVTRTYAPGDTIDVFGLFETVQALIPVDILTFENQYEGYLDVEQAARELYVGTATLQKWVTSAQVQADLVLPFGSRKIFYFTPERLEAIRIRKGLSIHTDETLKQDFLAFLKEKSYTFSFKMVFMLGMLEYADYQGEVRIDKVLAYYQAFYLKRLEIGLPVDRKGCVYTREYLEDKVLLKRNMLENPFEKFERKRFVYYSKDLGLLAFHSQLWKQIDTKEKQTIKDLLHDSLKTYYEELGGLAND